MKVLLATDGSQVAEEAAWLLSHLPHTEKLELTVLSVCYVKELHGSLAVVDWVKECVEKEKQRARQVCDQVAKMFEGANCAIEVVVADGHVGTSIIQEASARNVELIVLGSTGHSMLERMLLGSVSDFVVTHAACSVLVVRQTGIRNRHNGAIKVCIACDGSDACQFALSQLSRFEWKARTHFDLLSVVAIPFIYNDLPAANALADIRSPIEELMRQMQAELKDLSPEIKTHVLDASHVGNEIVRFAKENASDLIVVGDSGKGLINRVFSGSSSLGSVAKFVVRNSSSSVWVGRKPA